MTQKLPKTPSSARNGGHRQLRVGEQMRHIMAQLFMQLEFPELSVSVTVTQVKMSPDLKLATVYIMPLGGQHQKETLDYLEKNSSYIRYNLGKNIHLKFTPALKFRLDESFDQAERIEKMFKKTNL